MSRWTGHYQNFKRDWKQLLDTSQQALTTNTAMDTNTVQEIARLKKVLVYLDGIVKSIDPELIPLGMLDTFNREMQYCLDSINNSRADNYNTHHIQDANGHADKMLSRISPYITNSENAAQSAGRAFVQHANVINQSLEGFRENSKDILQKIENDKNEIAASKDNIETLENSYLNDEDNLQGRIETFTSDINSWHENIEGFHQKLTSGDDEEQSIIEQIEKAKTEANENNSTIKKILENSNERVSHLRTFYDNIFGKKDEDGKIITVGLKQELETRKKELDDFKNKQKDICEQLKENIEGLLPGATNASLATAYKEMKESFKRPIRGHSILFYAALAGILLIAVLLKTSFESISQMTSSILLKTPLIFPLLWLAIFSSKRRSENRRLEQEYAHKEAIAKSYKSFQDQIEKLNTENDALMEKLLETAITAIAFNASTTLDGKHGDKPPIQEYLDSIPQLVKDVSSIAKDVSSKK